MSTAGTLRGTATAQGRTGANGGPGGVGVAADMLAPRPSDAAEVHAVPLHPSSFEGSKAGGGGAQNSCSPHRAVDG